MTDFKLFMFYIGGDFRNANIELHDVRFSVGTKPQDCYEDLRKQWWGKPSSLHLDSWAQITYADGYDVKISTVPSTGKEKLFFLNLGGYDKDEFEEAHRNILIVANNQRAAIQKALQANQRMQNPWIQPHKDSLMELDKAISIAELFKKQRIFIHLARATESRALAFTQKYIPLNK